jgi:prepilin peptidase CpaA
LLPALFSGGLVFAATWYCWQRGWIGGGDVKLLSACVLLVPPESVPELILSTATAGGLLALSYLILALLLRGNGANVPAALGQAGSIRRLGLPRRIWRAERRRIHRGLSLPYSCAIAAGVLLTLYVPLG